jgi:ArsR family transcriptional regulator
LQYYYIQKGGPVTLFGADAVAAGSAAEILKAIAHPVRLAIIALLVDEESLQVNAIAERLALKQPLVSQQLHILRMHRLVEAERKNGTATYRLTQPHLADLVRCMENCLGRRGARR